MTIGREKWEGMTAAVHELVTPLCKGSNEVEHIHDMVGYRHGGLSTWWAIGIGNLMVAQNVESRNTKHSK